MAATDPPPVAGEIRLRGGRRGSPAATTLADVVAALANVALTNAAATTALAEVAAIARSG